MAQRRSIPRRSVDGRRRGPGGSVHLLRGHDGGGLWRTRDAGQTWDNLSDGDFATGSVGAVAVAPSDQNVIWVGMGEACIRG